MLNRLSLVKYEPNRRDNNDRRKKIAWAVFSYTDVHTGEEYRRSFSAPPFTPEIEFYNIAPKFISLLK